MTAVAFTEPDDVMINTEYGQNNCDVVPPDEMDDHGGHIYMMPSYNNAEILELKENKYYPWINKHEFWITEWLLTKANISHKAADELLLYIHEHARDI